MTRKKWPARPVIKSKIPRNAGEFLFQEHVPFPGALQPEDPFSLGIRDPGAKVATFGQDQRWRGDINLRAIGSAILSLEPDPVK